jgi:hypothetical protein
MDTLAGLAPAPDYRDTDPPLIVVPYIDGWLRPETLAAIEATGLPYATRPIEDGDPYGYAKAFEQWWANRLDLLVIEHDIVPPDGMITEMLECPEQWCSANYHVGGGRTTTGLGITKISHLIKVAYPYGGMNIARDPRDRRRYVDWISLNESCDRHLARLGYRQHIHFPNPIHLHYDQAPDAAT